MLASKQHLCLLYNVNSKSYTFLVHAKVKNINSKNIMYKTIQSQKNNKWQRKNAGRNGIVTLTHKPTIWFSLRLVKPACKFLSL